MIDNEKSNVSVKKREGMPTPTYYVAEDDRKKYAVNIWWSNEDNCYLAEIPELLGGKADGATLSELAKNIEEKIQSWIIKKQTDKECILKPQYTAVKKDITWQFVERREKWPTATDLVSNYAGKYAINVWWSEAENCYLAEAPELPGCKTDGRTMIETLENMEKEIQWWIVEKRERRGYVPKPQCKIIRKDFGWSREDLLQYLRNQENYVKGLEEAEERYSKLIQILLQNGKAEEVVRTTKDIEFREECYKHYNL